MVMNQFVFVMLGDIDEFEDKHEKDSQWKLW